MHWLALGTALLVALAIIAIGSQYVASPLAATRSFGHFLRTTPTSLGGFASRGARHRIGVGCTGVREVERAQRGRPHPACGSHHPRRRHASHSRSERLHQKRLRHHGLTAALMVLAAMPLMIGVPCDAACSFNLAPRCRLLWRRPLLRDRHARDAKRFRSVALPAVAIMSLFRDKQLECRRWTANPGH